MTLAKYWLAIPVVGAMMLLGFAGFTHAQAPLDIDTSLGEVGGAAGIDTTQTLQTTIGLIINVLLGFLGVIFLVLTIYAGFLWMTAGGNADQVEKAKKMLIQAIIGLVILLSAYAISNFVIGAISGATGTG